MPQYTEEQLDKFYLIIFITLSIIVMFIEYDCLGIYEISHHTKEQIYVFYFAIIGVLSFMIFFL